MASLTDIFVTVKPDMDKFGPEVKRKLASIDSKAEGSKVAGRFGVGFNGAFGGIVKHSAGLFVGAFAVIKGAQVFGGFINDARESAKVSRLSAAVIASTGGAAKITASQMGDLAAAISNKTGADDEAIQSGENLLATFTNIRNQTGQGNDIFNRATQSAVDLAAAMNNGVVDANGLKSANIQLGKALNDPVKGVTALSKVGVSFTAQQKAQIKTLVASGDVLGAQKVILGEVGKEFGGAAAAAADPLSRLQTITGNLAEKVGGFLLPVVDKFATWVGDTAVPKIAAFSDVFVAKVTPTLQAFGGFVRDEILPRLADFGGFLRDQVLPRLLEFGGYVKDTVLPAVKDFASNLIDSLGPAVKDVFGFVKDQVLPRLKDFAGFLKDTVVPKLAELADKLSKNKDFLVPFAATVATLVTALGAWVVVQGILNVLLAANPLGLIIIALAALVGGLVWAYKNSDTFKTIVDTAFKIVSAAAVFMWDTILKPIFEHLVNMLKSMWEAAQTFGRIIAAVFNAVKDPVWNALKWIIARFLDFVGAMIGAAADAFGWVPGIGPQLKEAAKNFNTFRDKVNTALAGINDQTVKVTPVVLSATGSKAAKSQAAESKKYGFTFARGGAVFGDGTATSDSIPAMLSNGEHVWTAREVKKAGGHAAVEQMRQTVMGFAKGGPVAFNVQTPLPALGGSISNIGRAAVAVARPVAQALANVLANALAVSSTPGPGGGVERWRGVALSALAAAGGSASWINSLLRRMNQESGGNPKAINLTDSNAKAGHPSQGLMQTIPSTFNAYAGKYRSRGITDPFANIFAAIRYTMDRYGSGPAGWDRAGGYSRGGKVGSLLFDGGRGYLPTGTSLVQNNTGKPEPLTRTDQALDLSDQTVRALGNVFAKALSQGRFRMVNSGGGAYVLQASNG